MSLENEDGLNAFTQMRYEFWSWESEQEIGALALQQLSPYSL